MKKKGFTLIELLVVIAIIGLLATIAAIALNNARISSRDTKRLGDMKQVQTAMELYFNAESSYPRSDTVADCTDKELSSLGAATPPCGNIEEYLPGLDNIGDPLDGDSTDGCDDLETTGCDYGYTQGTTSDQYTIRFYVEKDSATDAAAAKILTPGGIQ